MSQENVEIVRTRLSVRERSSRTLDQRLALRFPLLGAASARLIARLPPSSRLRRMFLARAVQIASEAYNRRDLAAVVVGLDPAFEYLTGREWVEAGLVEPLYRGLQGYRAYVATTSEVWGPDNHLIPHELIDLGDRFVVLATVPMRAQVSGVSLTEEFAYVATVKHGRPVRLQEYFDHAAALKAVGLEE